MLPVSLLIHLTRIILSQYSNFHLAANVFLETRHVFSLFLLILKLILSTFSISDILKLRYQSSDIVALSFIEGVFCHKDSKFLLFSCCICANALGLLLS